MLNAVTQFITPDPPWLANLPLVVAIMAFLLSAGLRAVAHARREGACCQRGQTQEQEKATQRAPGPYEPWLISLPVPPISRPAGRLWNIHRSSPRGNRHQPRLPPRGRDVAIAEIAARVLSKAGAADDASFRETGKHLQKVEEMPAILLQAKGARWVVVGLAGVAGLASRLVAKFMP